MAVDNVLNIRTVRPHRQTLDQAMVNAVVEHAYSKCPFVCIWNLTGTIIWTQIE